MSVGRGPWTVRVNLSKSGALSFGPRACVGEPYSDRRGAKFTNGSTRLPRMARRGQGGSGSPIVCQKDDHCIQYSYLRNRSQNRKRESGDYALIGCEERCVRLPGKRG